MLVSESETEAASTFLLVRQLPFPVELAGTFFPADGYVLLQQRETISLVCKTRYSHSRGWLDGREVRKDIPDPAPSSVEAMAWHIEADAPQLDRRVHFRSSAARKARHPRQRLSPNLSASEMPHGFQRHCVTVNPRAGSQLSGFFLP